MESLNANAVKPYYKLKSATTILANLTNNTARETEDRLDFSAVGGLQ